MVVNNYTDYWQSNYQFLIMLLLTIYLDCSCDPAIEWMHCEDTVDPSATWRESWRALERGKRNNSCIRNHYHMLTKNCSLRGRKSDEHWSKQLQYRLITRARRSCHSTSACRSKLVSNTKSFNIKKQMIYNLIAIICGQ